MILNEKESLLLVSRSLVFPLFSQSVRETKAAAHILQSVWAYKDLRQTLCKAGWNKTHFKVNDVFSFQSSRRDVKCRS